MGKDNLMNEITDQNNEAINHYDYFLITMKYLKKGNLIDLLKDDGVKYVEHMIFFIQDRFNIYFEELEEYVDSLYMAYDEEEEKTNNDLLDSDMIWHDIWSRFKMNRSLEYELNLYEQLKEKKSEIVQGVLKLIKGQGLKVYEMKEKEDCAICMIDMQTELVISCSNKHIFHEECLKKWFIKGKRDCPTCRTNI